MLHVQVVAIGDKHLCYCHTNKYLQVDDFEPDGHERMYLTESME